MPRQKKDAHIYELAKRGAEARLSDLIHEVKMLLGLFPHLRDSVDEDELPVAFILKRASDKAGRRAAAMTPGPRKRSWSAAQRKAAAQRMKEYWAARRSAPKK